MASANLELVRSLYDAWARGDYSWTDWADPAIEFAWADGPSPGSWKGLAGMREGWREHLSAWDEWRTYPDEFRELDDERVLVLVHWSGRGKTSGMPVEEVHAKGAGLFHIRDGKVTRLVCYWDLKRALADVGLVRR